jgi:hypothetical protein
MVNTIIKGANKKGIGWLYFVMYLAIIIIVIVVITKVYKAVKQGGKDIGNLATDVAVSAQTNIPVARLQQIRNIAEDCYKNWGTSWLGVADWDEPKFITAINQMQDLKELQIFCQNYTELGGVAIKDIVEASFDSSDIKRLKTGYYSAIKSF